MKSSLNQKVKLHNKKKEKSFIFFPFFINLKNFRLSTEFEDLILFEEWKELPSITFILDGLDEISNINDFISELEIFLKKYEDKK